MTSRSGTARRFATAGTDPVIRLMIVDDSSVARAILSRILSTKPEFEVVALAGNARQAIDALQSISVDIVLLDVEMPGASGLEALPEIIAAGKGARVLIVSSMAEDGAETNVRALALGAADTLPKPGSGNFAGRFADVLTERIRRIGRFLPVHRREPQTMPPLRLRAMSSAAPACVALGASTGGLHALIEFLRGLPKIHRPLLVTQHLPPIFMPHFARQLESASGRPACVVQQGQGLANDMIHLAPGDAHLCLETVHGEVRVRLERSRSPSNCLPSVDEMLGSVAETFGNASIGVILSGMGRDGLEGSRKMVERGGSVLAQDPHSAVVWGMPRVVAEAGLASAVLAPADLARKVADCVEVA